MNHGDKDFPIIALEPDTPVADAQPVLVGALQTLDVPGQLSALSQSFDGTEDTLPYRRIDTTKILASAVVNDDAPVWLAH